jgi:hypothetical protein
MCCKRNNIILKKERKNPYVQQFKILDKNPRIWNNLRYAGSMMHFAKSRKFGYVEKGVYMTEALGFINYCFLFTSDFHVLLKPSLVDPYKHSVEAKEAFFIHGHAPSCSSLISIRKTMCIFAHDT